MEAFTDTPFLFFIFVVGGSFQIITATGTIEAGIGILAKKLSGKENLMIPIFMIIFGLGGATLHVEETIVL